MARIKGALNATSNYEVQVRKPFDARLLVQTYDDLLNKENWYKSGTTQSIAYNGMFVAVANTTDTSKNGLYFLFDPTVSGIKAPNVDVESNWVRFGDTKDIEVLLSRISAIDESIALIEERIDSLEGNTPVEILERKDKFPEDGDTSKLYIAIDERKSYVWVDNGYEPVGGSDAPTIICGGNASA